MEKDEKQKEERCFASAALIGYIAVSEQLPPEGEIVMTKIDDENGIRNEQKLYRLRNLWWLSDGSMYVYYRPTHWKR